MVPVHIFCFFAETFHVSVYFKCVSSCFLECFCNRCFKVVIRQPQYGVILWPLWVLFPHKLRFSWFFIWWVNLSFPRHFEYYVMIFWLLFKSYNNIGTLFLFYQAIDSFGCELTFPPGFVWLLFSCWFCVQSLHSAFTSSHVPFAGGQSGTWVVVCLMEQFSKPMACDARVISTHVHFRDATRSL